MASVFIAQQGAHYTVIKKKRQNERENPKCSKLQLGSCMCVCVLIIIHR